MKLLFLFFLSTQVTLSWTNPSTTGTVTLLRAPGACTATLPLVTTVLTTTASAGGPWTDTTAVPGTTYAYWGYPTGSPQTAVCWTGVIPSTTVTGLQGFKGTITIKLP